MAKHIGKFFDIFATAERLVERLTNRSITPGSRVLPVNKNDDQRAQFRIDAGEKIDGKQNLVLQINSNASAKSLKKWVQSNGRGTHGQVATGVYDTNAPNKAAEAERITQELTAQAKERLG